MILGGKGKTSDGEEEQQRRRPTIMATKDYYVFMDNYQRLAEGSDMSVESTGSIPMSMSNGGNSISMSVADSSVGSNNSDSHSKCFGLQ